MITVAGLEESLLRHQAGGIIRHRRKIPKIRLSSFLTVLVHCSSVY